MSNWKERITKEQVDKCMEIFFTQFFMGQGPEKKAYLDKVMPTITEDENAFLQSLSDFAHAIYGEIAFSNVMHGHGAPATVKGVGPMPNYPPGAPEPDMDLSKSEQRRITGVIPWSAMNTDGDVFMPGAFKADAILSMADQILDVKGQYRCQVCGNTFPKDGKEKKGKAHSAFGQVDVVVCDDCYPKMMEAMKPQRHYAMGGSYNEAGEFIPYEISLVPGPPLAGYGFSICITDDLDKDTFLIETKKEEEKPDGNSL